MHERVRSQRCVAKVAPGATPSARVVDCGVATVHPLERRATVGRLFAHPTRCRLLRVGCLVDAHAPAHVARREKLPILAELHRRDGVHCGGRKESHYESRQRPRRISKPERLQTKTHRNPPPPQCRRPYCGRRDATPNRGDAELPSSHYTSNPSTLILKCLNSRGPACRPVCRGRSRWCLTPRPARRLCAPWAVAASGWSLKTVGWGAPPGPCLRATGPAADPCHTF